MNVGYARVSTTGQSLEVQLDALRKAGCQDEQIYQEKLSGMTADRPQLKAMLKYVRKGDTVYITKLDRLGRSLNDLSNIVTKLNNEGVGFVVLDQNINTTSRDGKLLFGILSTFAEFENDIRRERQMAGIKAAQDKGVKFGRRQTLSTVDVIGTYKVHKSIGETAKALNSTKPTIHRILKNANIDTSKGGSRMEFNQQIETMIDNFYRAKAGSQQEAKAKQVIIDWAREAQEVTAGSVRGSHQLPRDVVEQIDEIFEKYDDQFSGDASELPEFILERWNR